MRRTHLATIAAIGAAALGGSAIANAASSGLSTSATQSSTTQSSTTQSPQAPPAGRDPSLGGHQANGKTEKLLSGDTAAKVKAAALAKYPNATVQRVETDSDGVYEAHVVTKAGDEMIVQVGKDFAVTGTQTGGGPGGPGGRHGGGDHDGDGPGAPGTGGEGTTPSAPPAA